MLKTLLLLWLATTFTGICLADAPTTVPATIAPATTAPAATAPVADSPAQAQVRTMRLKDDVDCFTNTLAQARARMYTTTDRESDYADYAAHENWQASALEKVVRDKWGTDGDEAFIKFFGGTTIEQDKVADIVVDGDHATVADVNGKDNPARLIKVDGKWMKDVHADFVEWSVKYPSFDRTRTYRAPVMKQMIEDIKAGKYDDLDGFMADLKSRIGEIAPVNVDE